MNNTLERFQELMSSTVDQAYGSLLAILPKAALSILVIGLGIVIAAGLYFLAMHVMRFFAVDKLADKTPLSRLLKNAGIHKTVSEIVSLLIFWFVVFFTLVFASDILQLQQLSKALDIITRFIPRVIAALLIVFLGMLLARFLTVLVERPLKRVGMKFAGGVGKAIYAVTLAFVILFAIDQLGLDLSFVTVNVMIVLAALAIILGVGGMIACRGFLENVLACYQLRQMIKAGDHVEVNNLSGAVIGFTIVGVLIDSHGSTLVVPASLFSTNPYTVKRT